VTSPSNRENWSRLGRGQRFVLLAVVAACVALLPSLIGVFGFADGMAYYMLSLLPLPILGLMLPLWWGLRGRPLAMRRDRVPPTH
jgi:hypothetical protein